jgi:hypothetical protein
MKTKRSKKVSKPVLKESGFINLDNKAIEVKICDKKGFKITLQSLEKLYREALDVQKEPLLIIGIHRSATETFKLYCNLILEKR